MSHSYNTPPDAFAAIVHDYLTALADTDGLARALARQFGEPASETWKWASGEAVPPPRRRASITSWIEANS